VDYRMTPLPLTFSDLEGHVTVLNLSISLTSRSTVCIIYDMFAHESEYTHAACVFSYFFENEGLLKVTDSHVHCICGNIS